MVDERYECVEHQKVYSGEYYATNPPRWAWICERCGEFGHETAHAVHPKDWQRFARAAAHFYPPDSWWESQLDSVTELPDSEPPSTDSLDSEPASKVQSEDG